MCEVTAKDRRRDREGGFVLTGWRRRVDREPPKETKERQAK